jgi:hypothetical protein
MGFEVWHDVMPGKTRTQAEIDIEWPYQVIVRAHVCTGEAFKHKRDFCAGMSLCKRVGSVRINDVLYRVFCFKERWHAVRFAREFEGVRFLAVRR